MAERARADALGGESSSSDDEDAFEEEELDPRIQIELEKLNSSTDVINKLELDLEEARYQFRQLLNNSTRQLETLSKTLGSAVERSRCYYDARMEARKALAEAQHAAIRFEKASSAHEAAKEMVTLAEEGYAEKGLKFDSAWQEMLNHATNRVNESEKEKDESATLHKKKYRSYQKSQLRVQLIEKTLKRSINKSRPYFESKAKFNQVLDDQKRQVELIEETIQMTKLGYAQSLRELEKISEEIHERRQKEKADKLVELGPRGQGVGAEEGHASQEHGTQGQNHPIKRSTSYHRVQHLVRQFSRESAKFSCTEIKNSSETNSKSKETSPDCSKDASKSLSHPSSSEPTIGQVKASSSSSCSSSSRLENPISCPSKMATGPTQTESQVTSTSNSSTASPLPSPSYETLGSDEDDWQKLDVSGLTKDSSSDEDSHSERKLNAPVHSPCKGDATVSATLKDPRLAQVKEEFSSLPYGCGDDLSDAESLASMDMLSDEQIDLLIKGKVFSPRRRSLEPSSSQKASTIFERGTGDHTQGEDEEQNCQEIFGVKKSETNDKTSEVKRGHVETWGVKVR
ncbi:hypothetical protein TCAL_04158 [Tigriopus californicus]|uniref:SH3 domain-binding protein 5-like n=1 Tax=Tigriopus californicus TaxID=6832 RepID=A0A553NU98_TIGCA|nr:hypothetical protein TCAL_04158 [Tigriopus californicus]